MKQIILPVDTSKIEDPNLRKFIETLDLKAYLEIEESSDELILMDSYLVHENKEKQILPVKVKKKKL